MKILANIEQEYNALTYLRELIEDATMYYSIVIVNVFHGVSENIGVKNPDRLAQKPPEAVVKGFLDGFNELYRKFRKKIISRTPTKFTIRKLKLLKKDMTDADWKKFEKQLDDYLGKHGDTLSTSISVKSVLLALASAEEEKKRQNPEDYGKKSLEQIEKEYYDGRIPETIEEAKSRGFSDRYTLKSIDESKHSIAQYVRTTNEKIKNAIRDKVEEAIRNGKTPKELASDLYWMKKEDPKFKKIDPKTAQSLIRDWHRIAVTEMMMAHSRGKLSAYEKQAKESIKRPELAIYYCFVGGTCDWCVPHHGTILRHVPKELVTDENSDSLKSMGIRDPYTDIAVWIGKNNVGFKKPAWRVCTPAHPWNTAQLARIYPDAQAYNRKTGKIEYKTHLEGLLPEDMEERQRKIEKKRDEMQRQAEMDRTHNVHKPLKDYVQETPQSVVIGTDTAGRKIVSHGGTMYVEVSAEDYKARLAEWRENRHLPVPVAMGTQDHDRIFGR